MFNINYTFFIQNLDSQKETISDVEEISLLENSCGLPTILGTKDHKNSSKRYYKIYFQVKEMKNCFFLKKILL